jgi:hypothetical protein
LGTNKVRYYYPKTFPWNMIKHWNSLIKVTDSPINRLDSLINPPNSLINSFNSLKTKNGRQIMASYT